MLYIFSPTANRAIPKQILFAQTEFTANCKMTRRDRYLGEIEILREMEIVVSWARLL